MAICCQSNSNFLIYALALLDCSSEGSARREHVAILVISPNSGQ